MMDARVKPAHDYREDQIDREPLSRQSSRPTIAGSNDAMKRLAVFQPHPLSPRQCTARKLRVGLKKTALGWEYEATSVGGVRASIERVRAAGLRL
jgi:hypothetical protein